MKTKWKFLIVLALLAVMLPAAPARADPPLRIVDVCDEAHLLAALPGGANVSFTCSGTITLTETITIAADTLIDGGGRVTISGNHQVRVFVVNAVSLSLSNLTVANGYVDPGGTTPQGAGILNNGGTVSINASTFWGHDALYGGAIYNNGGTLTVTNSTFNSNTSGNSGAAIANTSVASVSGTTFRDNRVSSRGGAIWNYETAGRLTVSNSVFSNNSADRGGGISNEALATASVSNSTFSGNNAYNGGAISSAGLATLIVSNSTFDSNHAVSGAAIGNDYSLNVSNSTFSGNIADDTGGAILHMNGNATVYNSTFSGNSAAVGGGAIFTGPALFQLVNSIVANSIAGGNCKGIILDGGGNLNYPDSGRQNCPGVLSDPLLGPLQNNGGPTLTLALAPGSPAIDAAIDTICAAAPVNNLDQRGATRPSGLHCDIGAVEQQPMAGPPILIDIKPGTDPNSINCQNGNGVIAVALLTTDLFDATTVDHTTVTFQGAAETHVNRQTGEPTRHEKDVDGDGDVDLVFHFRLGGTTLSCQSTVGAMWGKTFAGESIVGTDWVRMVGED